MENSSLKELYTSPDHQESKDPLGITIIFYIVLFLTGLFVFPLGIALGMMYLDNDKRRAYAAFSGVFLFLGVTLGYIVMNWWDLLQVAKNAGWF